MTKKEAEKILKAIFLITMNWGGNWELFDKMIGPYFIDLIRGVEKVPQEKITRYKVTQKIKALGLQVGDIFEKEGKSWVRIYKTGAQIIVPDYIIESHPDFFEPVPKNVVVAAYKIKERG